MNGKLTGVAAAVPLALGLAANLALPPRSTSVEVPDHGAAIVMQHAVLWSGPSTGAERLGTVEAGEIITILSPGRRSGYIRVQTQDEEVGWVTDRRLRPVDESDVHEPRTTVATTTTALARSSVAGSDFDGCPAEGNPSPRGSNFERLKDLNRLKNRGADPSDADIDRTVTLDKLLEPSDDDSQTWSPSRAAEIVGYVYHVKPGGSETVNCKKADPAHRDSHIELVESPNATGPTHRLVVEVTPRWRAATGSHSVEWTTKALQQTIEGHCVRVRGWLFFDSEHRSQSENTNPGGASNWRATAWEIHPVSSLAVVPCP
jgi:uncharacterized protein YgiM (DUF1202 family)